MKLLLLPVLLFAVAEGGYRFGFGFDDCSWYGNCGYGYYGHYGGGYSDFKNYYGDYDYGYGGHGYGRYGKYKPHGGYINHGGKYKRDTDSQTKKDAVHVSGSLGSAVVSKLTAGFHAPHWTSVHGTPQLSHEDHHNQHHHVVPATRHEVPAPYEPHGKPHHEAPGPHKSLRPAFHESGHLNAPHALAPHGKPHHEAPVSYDPLNLPHHEVPAPYDHGKPQPAPYEPHGQNLHVTSLAPHAEGPKVVYHGPPVAIPNRPHPDYPTQLVHHHDQHHSGLPAFKVSYNEHPKPEEIYIDIEVLHDDGVRSKFSEGQLNQILSLIKPEHRHGAVSTDWRHARPGGPEVSYREDPAHPPVHHHEAGARPGVYHKEGPAHHSGLATNWLYKNSAEDYNLEHTRMAEPVVRAVGHEPVHVLHQDYISPHQVDFHHRSEPHPHHETPSVQLKAVHDHDHPYLRPIDTFVEGPHVAPAAPHHHQLHRPVVEGPVGHGHEHLSGHYIPQGEPSHDIGREHQQLHRPVVEGAAGRGHEHLSGHYIPQGEPSHDIVREHQQHHRPVVEGLTVHRPEHLSGHYMPQGEPSQVIGREHTYENVKEGKFSEFLMQNMGSYKA